MKVVCNPIRMGRWSELFQEDTACTRLECCRDLYKWCLQNPCLQRWGPDSIIFGQTRRRSLPPLLLTKVRDVESNPGPTTHTNKYTTVIWICDLCHKQINKKQTTIRCNHTHWAHLIKQQQYKPDWRCTIPTPTQNVTTTPSTAHHKQLPPTHSQTTINQRTKTLSYFKST